MGVVCKFALVAQLDRVSDYESEGQGFESLPARHYHLSMEKLLRWSKKPSITGLFSLLRELWTIHYLLLGKLFFGAIIKAISRLSFYGVTALSFRLDSNINVARPCDRAVI